MKFKHKSLPLDVGVGILALVVIPPVVSTVIFTLPLLGYGWMWTYDLWKVVLLALLTLALSTLPSYSRFWFALALNCVLVLTSLILILEPSSPPAACIGLGQATDPISVGFCSALVSMPFFAAQATVFTWSLIRSWMIGKASNETTRNTHIEVP